MSRYYGSWEYGSAGNGMRLVMDVTTSRVYHGSSLVRFHVKFYTQNRWRYDDFQFLNLGGVLSGQVDYNNTSGSNSSGGGLIQRYATTYTYNYGSGEYGSSPGSRSFYGRVTGAYNYVTPSVSQSVRIPARPEAAPDEQSGVTLTRPYTTRLELRWTRHSKNGKPYTSQQIRMREFRGDSWGGYQDIATVSGGATTYVKTSGVDNNTMFQMAIRAHNSAGRSSWVYSNIIGNYPAVPRNVRASLNSDGSSVSLQWRSDAYDPPASEGQILYSIQRRPGSSGSWSTSWTTTSTAWTDTSPNAGDNQYRVQTLSTVAPGTHSAWVESNVISTEVPPLAPTNLSPNGVTVDLRNDLTLSWDHNHGGDGSEQSHFTVFYSDDGTTWVWLANTVASTVSEYTVPGGTLPNSTTPYQWRVSTQGVTSEDFGPPSSVATFTGATTPVISITAPGAVTNAIPLKVRWDYSQAEGVDQAHWQVALTDEASGSVVELKAGDNDQEFADFDYRPEDSHTYTMQVQVRAANGLWTNIAETTTTLELPVPAAVLTEPEFAECEGTVTLSLTSENAEPIEPDRTNLATNGSVENNLDQWGTGFASNLIERKNIAGAWVGSSSVKTTWDGTSGVGVHFISGLTVGETYTASMRVWVPAGHPQVQAVCYFNTNGTATSLYDQWEELHVTFVATDANHGVGIGTVSDTPTDGQIAWVDGLIVEEGPVVPTYFDGDTPDLPNRAYSWVGTPHASTSLSQSRLEVEPTSAIVERRVEGGEWVTLASNLPIPSDIVDPLPSTTGVTEYRLTSVSSIPSYRVNPVVTVQGPDGIHGGPDAGFWGYLSYGDGFSVGLRASGGLAVSEQDDKVRGVQPFLGRAKPLLLTGDNTTRVVNVGSDLLYDEECPPEQECRFDSPARAWLDAGTDAGMVCWRDYTGRRIFGRLSGVKVNHGLPGTATLGFSVTETDYIEAYQEGI